MIIKLLGLMDLLSAILLIFLKYGIGESVAYIFVFYLIIKGLVFFGDFNSFLDIAAGVFILLAAQGFFILLTWLFILHLLQKAFFSLLT